MTASAPTFLGMDPGQVLLVVGWIALGVIVFRVTRWFLRK